MSLLGSLLSAGIGFFGNRGAARDQRRAGQQAAQMAGQGADFLQGQVGGAAQGGMDAFNQRQALLGLGGDPMAARQAFDDFQNSTGFQSALDTGSRAITGNRAARGILDSGRTGTALTQFGGDLGRQSFGQFFDMLGQQQGAGLGAANNIAQLRAGAGQTAGNALMGGAQRSSDFNMQGFQDLAGGIGAAGRFFQNRRPGTQ